MLEKVRIARAAQETTLKVAQESEREKESLAKEKMKLMDENEKSKKKIKIAKSALLASQSTLEEKEMEWNAMRKEHETMLKSVAEKHEREMEEHEKTRDEHAREKEKHVKTREEHAREKEEHEKTRGEHAREKEEHEKTRGEHAVQFAQVKEEHETALSSVRDQLKDLESTIEVKERMLGELKEELDMLKISMGDR